MPKNVFKITSTKIKSMRKLMASLTYDCDIKWLIKTNLYHVVC